jgi:hypothetical protein
MAMKMITELCGDDEQNGQKLKISVMALDRRIGLWDAIEETITMKSKWFNLLISSYRFRL